MLNIERPGTARPATAAGFRPRVLEGARFQVDVGRLEATMAVLEDYVESMLAAEEGAAMDSWLEDLDVELRMVSL